VTASSAAAAGGSASQKRHPREGGDPRKLLAWMPVYTGMTLLEANQSDLATVPAARRGYVPDMSGVT